MERHTDAFDLEMPHNFKWGISSFGQFTIWPVAGGADGFPRHRAYLEQVWRRPVNIGAGDIIGIATYKPATIKFDGTVVAPAEMWVQALYGAMPPQEFYDWSSKYFPNVTVREQRIKKRPLL